MKDCPRHTSWRVDGYAGNWSSFEIEVIDICRFEAGKVVEHWGVPDRVAQMVQRATGTCNWESSDSHYSRGIHERASRLDSKAITFTADGESAG